MNSKNILEFLAKETKKLLVLLDQPSTVKIGQEKEVFKIHLQTDQPGVLIGFKGKTLNALQTVLGLAVLKRFGPEIKILVDVNDYRQTQEEKLKNLALEAAARAKSEKKSIALPPMSAFERRLIHLFLAADPEIETVSEDKGNQRHVIVKLKNQI